ncbi:coiled-coil domain-containing protein 27 [Choloepus didactylus]|uniref:coiled-coil domain-containing protein 27 n=1 Tax=Choloepus didactylus TaxID=27675 RepID=UPI00189D8007|nr:coiled-coil domain-containing protein 27 [Choloepus didactylus]
MEADAPKKCPAVPSSMAKGLAVLQSVAARGAGAPEWKLCSGQRSLSKAAQTISRYYGKRSEAKEASSPGGSGFVSQVEELRSAFLMRPGCPQFSTRATSMSRHGLAPTAALPRDVCVSAEPWKMRADPLSAPQGSDTSVKGLPVSKSACEVSSLWKGSKSGPGSPVASSPIVAQGAPRKRVPWYISVIHEKDNQLFRLGEEVQHLLELEAQSRKKDQVVSGLLEEKRALKRQLRRLLKTKGRRTAVSPGLREADGHAAGGSQPLPGRCGRPGSPAASAAGLDPPELALVSLTRPGPEGSGAPSRPGWQRVALQELRGQAGALKDHPGPLQQRLPEAPPKPRDEQEEQLGGKQVWSGWGLSLADPREQLQEEHPGGEKAQALEGGGSREDEDLERGQGPAAKGGAGEKGALQEGEMEEEEEEEDQDEDEDEEEGRELGEQRELREEEEAQGRRRCSVDDAFEEELIARLEKCEQVIQELQHELAVARSRHSMATGTIMSLQRQVDFQESQMRKLSTENQLVQQELRERKHQLQAMTDKFSNLREVKKHAEMMGLVEKDNLLLREQVLDLERELRKREHVLSEYDTKVGQLQAQVDLDQSHLQRQKQLQDALQSRNEMIQQAEQQARVALESAQSRLERLRNKIIQATFSTVGIRSLSTEISDNDILECLQRVIAERTEYYNQLKQKGVKVPPLNQAEVFFSPNKAKKSVIK